MPQAERERLGPFIITSQRNLSDDGSIVCSHCQKVLAVYSPTSDSHTPTPQNLTRHGAVPIPNFGWFCSQRCATTYESAFSVRFQRNALGQISYYDELLDHAQQPEGLISVLLDKSASISDRDDAAMDLGDYNTPEVIHALATIAGDMSVDEIVRASCGESLANLWIAHGKIDNSLYEALVGIARQEAERLLNAQGIHHDETNGSGLGPRGA